MGASCESSGLRDTTPRNVLQQLLLGYRFSLILCVAAKLGIADLLRDGPQDIDGLARATGAHPGALHRLLWALTSVGVVAEDSNGGYRSTPLAALLQSDVPGSMRTWAIAIGETWWWRPWEELLYSVKTGKPAFDHVFGMPFFEYFAQNRDAAATFDAFMSEGTRVVAQAAAAAYDFSAIDTVVDVGGGNGTFLAVVLKTYPHMRGVLFDLPGVIRGAKAFLESEGVASCCQILGGDFFESVPDGGDAYILKYILHDWDDERSVAILRNCQRSMRDRGKVLLVERVAHPTADPETALSDLNMLVLLTGRERSAKEYQALLDAAGLAMTRVVPTQTSFSIVEAVRA